MMNYLRSFTLLSLFHLATCSISIARIPEHDLTEKERFENRLSVVFAEESLRAELALFLEHVLKQVPAEKFYALVDRIKHDNPTLSDIALYEKILTEVSAIKPLIPFYAQLKALAHQKQVLGNQARQLLQSHKRIDGCVEIGTPATYTSCIQKFTHITGNRYVINDKERLSDLVQSFTPNVRTRFKSYDRFVPLNDYAPIPESAIASNSVDLVVCFIGLHHIPRQKLHDFVQSIQRILRPGGIFLLRDHNAYNDKITSIVYAAHSVYNAIMTSETPETEMNEYRNFQPLSYWINLLLSQGFSVGDLRLRQVGDPTENTMLAFTKQCSSQEEHEHKIKTDLNDHVNYNRPLIQSYLSAPEWFNVDIAQEYGDFINHTPFYQFPYMQSVKEYWEVFIKSLNLARKKTGWYQSLSSPSNLMNLFIGITMTVEFSAKSLISLPVRCMYAGAEPEILLALADDPQNELDGIKEIIIHKRFDNTSLALIAIPRYKKFIATIQQLAKTNILLKEIAGQEEIQVKVRYKTAEHKQFPTINGCIKEYDWHLATQPSYTYAALTAQIPELSFVLKQCALENIEVVYIHDF